MKQESMSRAALPMQMFWVMLTILFIGLKLTGHIDWSWWLVLLPVWGGFVLAFAVVAFCVGIVVLARYRTQKPKERK